MSAKGNRGGKRKGSMILLPSGGAEKGLNVAGMTPDAGKKAVDGNKTIDSVEGKIVGLDHEQLWVVDKDGYAIIGLDGQSGSVGFTAETAKKFVGTTVTHNHPRTGKDSNQLGGTFSEADIGCLKFGMKELRATAKEGTYSIKSTSKSNAKGFADYVNSSAGKAKQNEFIARKTSAVSKMVNSFTSRKEYQDAHFNGLLTGLHDFYGSVAKDFGFKYSFKPSN